MRSLLWVYGLAGFALFGYLEQWRALGVWLILMIVARSGLVIRERIEACAFVRERWFHYFEHLKAEALKLGLVVSMLFIGSACVQVLTIGLHRAEVAAWYDQPTSNRLAQWLVSPFVHSDWQHWGSNWVMAVAIVISLPIERPSKLFGIWLGSALIVAASPAMSALYPQGSEFVVVGASAGLAGLMGAGWCYSQKRLTSFPPYFSRIFMVQFCLAFGLLSSLHSMKSVAAHGLGFGLGFGLAKMRKPEQINCQTR